MINVLNDVKAFHKLFNHPVLDTPTIPDEKRCVLRVGLLVEEVKEFQQAIKDNNIVEVADAFADIQYVLAGAIHEFGLANLFPKIFDEVQRSNMSKACETIDQANATIAKNEPEHGPCHIITKEVYDFEAKSYKTVYIVARDSDDKTLKSVGYSPADLKFVKQGL